MNPLRTLKVLALSLLLALGLAACDKPGPGESAGKKLDQMADTAGKKIGETAEKMDKKLEEQGAQASLAIEDAEITGKVKAAIFAEPGLKSLQIGVDTVKGVVTLSGAVDSEASSERARTLAAATAGVKSVENRLVLTSSR
ncbi:MAG TPA: BON domain-containing protein [Azospira sp.]|nr:BON domain-containing protein [Azospira sp.]